MAVLMDLDELAGHWTLVKDERGLRECTAEDAGDCDDVIGDFPV